jgi:uncharacterized protein
VQLLGVTEQLIGEAWLSAKPFRWCGNIGPIPISSQLRQRLQVLGEVLVRQFGLRGLFGVDFILRDDCFWPVEINPRYTGAVEVLEYSSGDAFLGEPSVADGEPSVADGEPSVADGEPSPVRGRVLPTTRPHTGLGSPIVGKAIVFAKHDFRFPDDGPWMDVLRFPPPIDELPSFADIPAARTWIETGQPVLTLLACGNTVSYCRGNLQAVALKTQQALCPEN